MREHPATYSKGMIDKFRDLLIGELGPSDPAHPHVVLDPFAGVGTIHQLRPEYATVGVELEPEWAQESPYTYIGDSTDLPGHWGDFFDAVATSPTYGNRMADHHDAKDGSKRHTYRHTLGRPLTKGNTGGMQWGDEYKNVHMRVWREVARVLRPGGVFILNVSDHIRKGEVVQVAEWHRSVICVMGFTLVSTIQMPTPRQRHGANGHLRVDHEVIYTFRRNRQ